MIPLTQIRTVDPFSSYYSDNVNKLTRILTAGTNKISTDDMLLVSQASNTLVSITNGVCVKDDVVIQFPDDMTIDVTDTNNWIVRNGSDSPGAPSPYPFYAYLVLQYTYEKVPDPNVAKIMILKHRDDFTESQYLFLAMLKFQALHTLEPTPDGVHQTDPAPLAPLSGTIIRQILNLHEAYTDQKARDAQWLNPITVHQPAILADRNKVVATNPSNGAIELIAKSSIGSEWQQSFTSSDAYVPGVTNGYDGSGRLVVEHNFGRYPLVQIIDNKTGNSLYQVIPGEVYHPDQTKFYIVFYQNELRSVTVKWQ